MVQRTTELRSKSRRLNSNAVRRAQQHSSLWIQPISRGCCCEPEPPPMIGNREPCAWE